MVATPQTFVATTIGRVAIPKLADTLVRTGADKFIKQYGQKAFEAVLGTAIGARAYSKTEEYISEYINHIDNGGDENSFVPKGSMPTATRSEQMDAMMAVPDTTTFADNTDEGKEEETTGTELSTEVKEEPSKLPEEPPKGPDIGTELATEAAVQTTKKVLEKNEDTTPGIGHNQPPSAIEEQTDDLITKTKTKHYKGELTATDTLNSDLMDALAKLAGTPEDIAKSQKLPSSHKKKVFWSLEDYITKHYPAKLTEVEGDHEGEALFYIASAVTDAYTNNGKVPDDIILVEDDKGIPMGAAEIEIYPKGKVNFYPKRKTNKMVKTEPAIYIEGIGSFNRKTTDLLLEKIEFLAESEDIRYIVGEDLTSEGALKALSLRGFKPAKKGFFEGEIINEADWRGGKKGIKAKNMVLDLGEKYATTQEEINKELEKQRIQEQTEKLIKK